MKKLLLFVMLMLIGILLFTACATQASVASTNLSKAAEQFEVYRRVVFYNGITDTYMLTVDGFCSIEADTLDGQLELTCRIGPDEFKKHYLGLSDNVTYIVEQLDAINVDPYHHRMIFRPSTIIPVIELDTQ